MKFMPAIFLVTVLTACSGLGRVDPGDTQAMNRSARNLCEVMRSKEPYRPNECGEFNAPQKSGPS